MSGIIGVLLVSSILLGNVFPNLDFSPPVSRMNNIFAPNPIVNAPVTAGPGGGRTGGFSFSSGYRVQESPGTSPADPGPGPVNSPASPLDPGPAPQPLPASLPGSLSVGSVPPGASISINGSDTGRVTPYPFEKPAGPYEVVVTRTCFVTPQPQIVMVVPETESVTAFTLVADDHCIPAPEFPSQVIPGLILAAVAGMIALMTERKEKMDLVC